MGLEVVAIARHGMLLRRFDRDPRGLLATKAVGRAGPAPGAQRRAAAKRRMAKPGCFASRCKGPKGRRKRTGRSHCWTWPFAGRSPARRPGRGLSGEDRKSVV